MRVVFIDSHLGLDHAMRLGVEGAEVAYFNEWRHELKLPDYLTGEGFEGINRVTDYHNLLFDWADVVFIADSGYGVLGDMLRQRGVPVFGASVGSDFLELSRYKAAELMRTLGIRTPDYHLVTGIRELYEYVTSNPGKHYVKLNVARGHVETFGVERGEDVANVLTRSQLGPFAHSLQFIVSREITGTEIGVDAWFDGRDFVRPYHFGNEVKGFGLCFGKWVHESIWDDVLDRIAPYLRRVGFTGTISFEAILNEDGLFVLDVTPRLARPAGSLQYYSLKTPYTEVVRAVATGEDFEFSLAGTYTAQVQLVWLSSPQTWTKICSYDDWRKWGWLVLTDYAVNFEGDVWVYVPADSDIHIFTLACGDNWVDTLRVAFARATEIGHEGFAVPTSAYKQAVECVRELERLGIDW